MANRPMKRRKPRAVHRELYAYDLETTRIKAGTPTVCYITGYGADWELSKTVSGLPELADILKNEFLIPERARARFVAWNGNKFDAYFIGLALLDSPEFILRPYLTRNKTLRGLRVINRDNEREYWEFLDGLAMTGLQCKLSKFVDTFAPGFKKYALNFDTTEFDPLNPEHVRYAMRDSEALWHAIQRVDELTQELTAISLKATIGAVGVRYMMSQLPENVLVWPPPPGCRDALREGGAIRGGFCFCPGKYEGPTWKYDINQAYAAAMRDAKLPAGRCIHTRRYRHGLPGIYRVTATAPNSNRVPFYYTAKKQGVFAFESIEDAWIASIEIDQLQMEGWKINIHTGYYWTDTFNLTEMVNTLEHTRTTDPEGPNGPLGTVCKAIGNNAYGKTLEQLDGLEIVMSRERPDQTYLPYQDEAPELGYFWFRFVKPFPKDYHRPQIGCFITAHVRMVVRRAALQDPAHWRYADTDCVAFSRPMPELDIDPKQYGKWKQETDGEVYRFIAKKVYATLDTVTDEQGVIKPRTAHAKGLNVTRLTADEFNSWYHGEPPQQTQIQRAGFVKVLSGFDMFVTRTKTGEKKPLQRKVKHGIKSRPSGKQRNIKTGTAK